MMNLLSEEKSLPQKISEDIIALILEENLQPGDQLPKYCYDPPGLWYLYCLFPRNGGRSTGLHFYRQ